MWQWSGYIGACRGDDALTVEAVWWCSESSSGRVEVVRERWSSDGASGWKGPGGGRKHAVGSRIGRSGG